MLRRVDKLSVSKRTLRAKLGCRTYATWIGHRADRWPAGEPQLDAHCSGWYETGEYTAGRPKQMPIESPYELIAQIKSPETAIAFVHLAERVEEQHFWELLAEWAEVDRDDLDDEQLGATKDGAQHLHTPHRQVAFAEWLRQRLCKKEHPSFAPMWFAPYQQKIYLAQNSMNHWKGPQISRIVVGVEQARRLRDRLNHVLATHDFDGREIVIAEE
jgi:hypothetical protein